MEIKDSPLYKALCEDVRKEDHAELLRMLELAGPIRLDESRLYYAFDWHATPQGYAYWSELHRRIAVRNDRSIWD